MKKVSSHWFPLLVACWGSLLPGVSRAQTPAGTSGPAVQSTRSPNPPTAVAERTALPRPDFSFLGARVENYTSNMDGQSLPYGFCEVGPAGEAKGLLVLLMPGASSTPERDVLLRNVEEHAARISALGKSCIVIRPTGRGPGSRYANYGEIDALEAIEDACQRFPVDRDRIYLFGHSMGGAATWYLAAHYPDLFACAIPSAGYCDYRLWTKAGGHTYPVFEWEIPAWESRCAAFIVENFMHTPVWIWHGELDRALGGGVPVEHSRQMHQLLSQRGYRVKYSEVPGEGHHLISPRKNVELMDQYLLWMLDQRKTRDPQKIEFTTYWLRHHKSYWVDILQLEQYGRRANIHAEVSEDQAVLTVNSQNIRAVELGPIPGVKTAELVMNGENLGKHDFSVSQVFHAKQQSWQPGVAAGENEKRPGRSGPISDLFFDNVIYVGGSTGTDQENYFTQTMARFMEAEFRRTNGGFHRGGIPGENTANQRVATDIELTEAETKQNQLILFGTDKTNSLIRNYLPRLPLQFDNGSLQLAGVTYRGEDVAVLAIFPHPDNPDRCLAIHGGVSADATVFGSHLNLMQLPDYIVYDRSRILAWGFWNSNWD